jgi:hypothetical protein
MSVKLIHPDRGKMQLMDTELSPNPRSNILAIVAILGLLGALPLVIYANDREMVDPCS